MFDRLIISLGYSQLVENKTLFPAEIEINHRACPCEWRGVVWGWDVQATTISLSSFFPFLLLFCFIYHLLRLSFSLFIPTILLSSIPLCMNSIFSSFAFSYSLFICISHIIPPFCFFVLFFFPICFFISLRTSSPHSPLSPTVRWSSAINLELFPSAFRAHLPLRCTHISDTMQI
jgi:hypothetical protein